MATDITTQLIQMIKGGTTPTAGLAVNSSVLGNTSDLLSRAANYAQILGTAVGPTANAAALAAVGGAAKATADAAGQAALLSASAASAGIGAAIVLIISFILGELADSSQSDQSQLFQELSDEINKLTEDQLATYWLDKMTGSLSILWSPLGVDLDNLANETTGGVDVTTHVSDFHDHALAFVNHLTKDIGWDQYWQVPPPACGGRAAVARP